MHSDEESGQEKSHFTAALPHKVHWGIPVFSVLMLITLASLVASGQGTSPYVFIPIFLAMVIIYVFASMYLFKQIVDKDQSSIEQ